MSDTKPVVVRSFFFPSEEESDSICSNEDSEDDDFIIVDYDPDPCNISEEDRVQNRAAVLATSTDINVCHENELDDFEAMTSDSPSDDESYDSTNGSLPFVNSNARQERCYRCGIHGGNGRQNT